MNLAFSVLVSIMFCLFIFFFSDHGSEFELGVRAQHEDEVPNLKSVPSSCSVVSIASQRYVSLVRFQFLFLTH